jgi:ABC-2 type transport system permease protein
MTNLLKSDLYRFIHSRAFWVAMLAAALAVEAVLWSFQSTTSIGSYTPHGIEAALLNDGAAVFYPETAQLLGSALLVPNSLNLICCTFMAFALTSDFETGYVKNIWSAGKNRTVYLLEKLVLCLIVCAVFLIWSIILTLASAPAWGIFPQDPLEDNQLMLWIGLTWITLSAYLFLTATVGLFARSRSIALVAAILLGTGIFGNVLVYLCELLSTVMPIAEQTPVWLPAANIQLLVNQSLQIDQFAPHMAIVALIALASCTMLTLILCRRKDIR